MKNVNIFNEMLASVVVFLVALPLCMGVAIASGAPPATGLISGIIGGLVVGFFAGSPLQVSGPAAGLAVIVYQIIQDFGIATLAPILILAGILQMLAGKLKFGQWFRAIAPAVIYGMLSGIGVLIFASQFHVMVDDIPVPNGSGLDNLYTIPASIKKGLIPADGSPHHLAAAIGVLTLIILISWNWLKTRLPKGLGMMPAPLLAVGVAVGVAQYMELPIKYVDVPSSLGDMLQFPTMASVKMLLKPAVFGSAIALAIIASAESLLCALAVDKLHEGERSDLDKELFAQGIGNTIAGLVGALPITGVIVRSTANVEAGGTTRFSAILHGFWLILALVAVPSALKMIPVASLAAVLVYIGWKLVKVEIAKKLLERGRDEFAIYLATVIAIVATNLLQGLLVGIVLAVFKLAWNFSRLSVRSEVSTLDQRIDLHLDGSGTFVGLPKLARSLQQVPQNHEVHIHLEHVDYIDHACFELISDWKKDYQERGGEVHMEWEALEKRATYRSQLSN